jgi:hypothetical protein
MMRPLLTFSLAACCLVFKVGPIEAQSPTAKGRPAAKNGKDVEPVPGYKYREIEGFRLLVSKAVLDQDAKSNQRRKPMETLELELAMIARDLPPKAVAILRTIPTWVEWHTTDGPVVAQYRSGNKPNKRYRFESLEHAVKSNCVEIVRMDSLTAEHQGERHRCVLLHEFTHAVHHHLFDYDHPTIKAAYAHAKSQNLYAGQYAATNEREYFAEISCAYFGHLHYQPRTREELKTYDPTGYRMMELTWGTPEEIERAQKPERERNAMFRFNAAKRLLRDKQRKPEALSDLRTVIKEYPNTRAAKEAKKVLDKEAR